MREILFRGKCLIKGNWVYGNYEQMIDGKADKITNIIITHDNARCSTHTHIDRNTLGQYTGLKDENGNKIFEGDIFKFKDEIWESSYTSCGTEYDSWEVENYAVVGYNEDTARFEFVKYKFDETSVEADLHENHDLEFADFVSELEIVGNIHDNPELLKGE